MTQTEIKHQAWGILLDNLKCTSCETEHKIENLVSTASKEDAIAFGEWLVVNYVNTVNNQWRTMSSDKTYTTSELYDIYSADKNKEGV